MQSEFGGKRVLVVGASSDLAAPLISTLLEGGAKIGMHYHSNPQALKDFQSAECKHFKKDLTSAENCYALVEEYVAWSGGLDYLVQLSGGVRSPTHWEQLSESDVWSDLNINLISTFFLAQRSVLHMKKNKDGGRIVLMSNAGATHGGGSNSMIYGVAKAGVERLVRGMAKDCAKLNIIVNCVAPGFIESKIHKDSMQRSAKEIEDRINLIPLKRAGTAKEVASTILFLLSSASSYIVGQSIAISGGDWL